MPFTCCTQPSIFKMCFGGYINSKKRNALANNRVGSTHTLNDDVYKDNYLTSVNGKKGELLQVNYNDIQRGKQKYIQPSNDTTEKSFQEGISNDVIVQQPINKIKIVNVTYQKTLYKQNTVNRKRISISETGDVNNTSNSIKSNSVDSSPEGM